MKFISQMCTLSSTSATNSTQSTWPPRVKVFFFLLFYVKNSIYCPLNSLTINWCLITYVAAARERDKYAAEPVTDSLKNERERERERENETKRERLPHSSTSHGDCSISIIIHRSSHCRNGVGSQDTSCNPTNCLLLANRSNGSRFSDTGRSNNPRVWGLHTYRHKPSPLTLEPLKNIVKSVKEGKISFKMKTSIIFRPRLLSNT